MEIVVHELNMDQLTSQSFTSRDIFDLCLMLGETILGHLQIRFDNEPNFMAEVRKYHYLFVWYLKKLKSLMPVEERGLDNFEVIQINYTFQMIRSTEPETVIFNLRIETLYQTSIYALLCFLQFLIIKTNQFLKTF